MKLNHLKWEFLELKSFLIFNILNALAILIIIIYFNYFDFSLEGI